MTWSRGKTSDGKPDPMYIECKRCGQLKSSCDFRWMPDKRLRAGGRHLTTCKKCYAPEPKKIESIESRFWKKVIKSEAVNGCWNWRNAIRYGIFYYDKRRYYAHRFSWRLHYGEIADGLFVCHKCDNKKCVNPSHLFLGTNKDNIDDLYKKGKGKKSRLFVNFKEIIERSSRGERKACLAKEFKCNVATIQRIVRGFYDLGSAR